MSSSAEEMRRYRVAHPESLDRDKELARARKRALNQLANAHPAEYVILLDTVCADMGIDPPGRPTGTRYGREQ